mgnify:CR=1 FL=1
MTGIYTPNLYRFITMEIFMDAKFLELFNKNRPKNVGLVHLFNEKFMEHLIIRFINILANMSHDDELLDITYYHKNRGNQQMSEFLQTEVEKEMNVMTDIGEETVVLEKGLNIKKGKINQFYPIMMWWKTSEDIKREDILSLKKAMLEKAMTVVADVIMNVKTTVFEYGFLLQYEPIIRILKKKYPKLATSIVMSQTTLEEDKKYVLLNNAINY